MTITPSGIEVKWIGHGDLAHYRGAYGFKDKDDRTDAFCLTRSNPITAMTVAQLRQRWKTTKGSNRDRHIYEC